MSQSDPIADMLTIIRNAGMVKFQKVDVATSKMKLEITKILKTEGYIKTFKKVTQGNRSFIRIFLKYDGEEKPVIRGIKRISTPGRRVYAGYRNMPRILNGFGVLIVSTSQGVITGRKAREHRVGGELVCSVW